MRREFGAKRDEVTGQWGELYNEKLNDLYCSPNIFRDKSRRTRWAGHVAGMGERRDVYRVLVGKTEGKRPLGRPRRRQEDNIKMDLQDVGCGGRRSHLHRASITLNNRLVLFRETTTVYCKDNGNKYRVWGKCRVCYS